METAYVSNGSRTLLIVEDEPGWCAVYGELLAEHACHYAVSYGEARGLLQRHTFALAIVDLHLASPTAREENRDGFWLLKATRQRGVPAIVVSALGAREDIDRAYDEFGVFAFIEKELFDRRGFKRTVAEALLSTTTPHLPVESESDLVLEDLTDREREVLARLTSGATNRQIAEALHITPNTVKKHVDHILQKLNVSSRAGAVAVALRAGLPASPN